MGTQRNATYDYEWENKLAIENFLEQCVFEIAKNKMEDTIVKEDSNE